MNPPLPHEQMIERQLAELTNWQGAQPELWRTALEKTASDKRKSRVVIERFLTWPAPKLIAASLLVVLGGIVITALLLPQFAKARDASAHLDQAVQAPASEVNRYFANDYEFRFRSDTNGDADRSQFGSGGGGGGTPEFPWQAADQEARDYAFSVPLRADQSTPQSASNDQSAAERSVIRKATIELITDDVRSTFLKAMHLVSEAGGEFIQDSALTGTGKEAQANLTLRVSIDRLSAVLNDLRNLGKVRAEAINGEDVTAQVVDLDARLRNEQRIETELLQLLDKRNDAPLKEILELRDNIGQVRQRIEQITAQREKLSRLVSLATVLVIIKTENAPPPPPEPKKETIGQYFGHAISADWHNGLQVLADTIAGALKILVGGLVWWVALIGGLLMLRQYLRRKAALAGV